LAWPEFANLEEELQQAFILQELSAEMILEGTGESYNFFFYAGMIKIVCCLYR